MAIVLSKNKSVSQSSRKSIDEFNHERLIREADPNNFEAANEMFYPDLLMKGANIRHYDTNGKGLLIKLNKLHVSKLNDVIMRRNYIRMAFVRIVWTPSATDLPGEVVVGIKDLRAKEGFQIVDSKEFQARDMQQYTYQQEIYFHKSEASKFGIFVNLQNFEEKYPVSCILGSIRLYWVLHTSNVPTQHEKEESSSSLVKKLKMPSLRSFGKTHKSLVDNLKSTEAFESTRNSCSNESFSNRIIELEENKNNDAETTHEYRVIVNKELNLSSVDDLDEKTRQKIENLVLEKKRENENIKKDRIDKEESVVSSTHESVSQNKDTRTEGQNSGIGNEGSFQIFGEHNLMFGLPFIDKNLKSHIKKDPFPDLCI